MEKINIPFLDLSLVNRRFEKDFIAAQKRVLSSDSLILGKAVTDFEKQFAHFCGVSACVGTGNGLDALTLIFKAYILMGKLRPGDEVLVPAHTYIATLLAVVHAGLVPVLVEPEEETFLMSIADAERKITSKTKAVVPVHLYGQLCDMKSLGKWAERHHLIVVEDAAQAHGASYFVGNKAGSLGHAAAFSFYPTKNLGALGDGGAVSTNDLELADVVRKLTNYGRKNRSVNQFLGYNSRLDTLQAAFLSVKLPHLINDNACRRQKAEQYLSQIKNPKILLPKFRFDDSHVFHQFVIRSEERDKLCAYLNKEGVQTDIHYPIPPHKQLPLQAFCNSPLPVTEKLAETVLSLPMNPILEECQIAYVIDLLNRF